MTPRRALVLFVVGFLGCAASPEAEPRLHRPDRPEPARAASRVPPIELPSLEGEPLLHVDLPGGVEAWVAVPVGAREPRRVIVGVHGAGDRADWSCTEWRATTGGEAWVVCPKGGLSRWDGFQSWGSAEQIASRADLAVAWVKDSFGPYVSTEPMTYGGWSQGGTLGASVVASRPGLYDTAVLVETGYTPLDEHVVARDLVRGGITRVLVSCSSAQCRSFSERLDRARPPVLAMWTNDVGLRGHWFDQPVFDSLGKVMRDLDSTRTGAKAPSQ